MMTKSQFPGSSSALGTRGDQLIWKNPAAWVEQKVTANDGQADDLFGFRVLLAGDTAFISAPAPIYRPGSVYVFTYSAGVWTQTQKLVANPDVTPPPGWSDFFGWSLAISGDSLLVGSPFTFNTQGPSGAAFIFTYSGGAWTQTQELKASDGVATDYFGWSVGLKGTTAAIGAYNKNGGEGAAYIFANSGGTWSQTQELVANDGVANDGHQFGEALDIDRGVIAIGAPGPDYVSTGTYPQGAVYVFQKSAGSWTQLQKLTATDGTPGDQFGFAVALVDKLLLIGSPAANIGTNPHQGAAYLFGRNGNYFSQTTKLAATNGEAYDQFGQSVALRAHQALIGEWSHDDDPTHTPPPAKAGISYFVPRLTRDASSAPRPIRPSDSAPGDSFGWDVDLEPSLLLIGAQGTVNGNVYQGAAYFFSR